MGETEESGGSRAINHNANQLTDGERSWLVNTVSDVNTSLREELGVSCEPLAGVE